MYPYLNSTDALYLNPDPHLDFWLEPDRHEVHADRKQSISFPCSKSGQKHMAHYNCNVFSCSLGTTGSLSAHFFGGGGEQCCNSTF
jgi:hypothetical protein